MNLTVRSKLSVRRCGLGLLALLTTLTAAGCNTVPSQVGPLIAKRLPAMLGPADNYAVNVNGDIFEAMRGKIRSVHIHGDNVALSPGLHVHVFDADATDIHVDTRTETVSKIGHVRFEIAMNQADLDSYMNSSRPDDVRNGARITLGSSLMTFADNVGFWSMRTRFAVAGRLTPTVGHPNQMDFDPDNAQLARLTIPVGLIRIAVNHQNPVVDLSKMKYPVAISSAQISNGVLMIRGTADMSALIGTNPAATSGQTAPPNS